MSKIYILLITTLTLFSFVLRLYRSSQPNHYYFDEVYHVVTARAYSQNNPEAYNPFALPPEEGTAFDWLHPPLAKLIQAGSIKLIGDKAIGWRLPSIIFGTAIIPATFILANILFGPLTATFASFVIAFENLTFVMSRITMNDVFVTFFIIVSFIFSSLYIRKKKVSYLLLTALFLGFSVSSKWTGMYAILAITAYVLFLQIRERRFNFRILFLIIVPAIIYIASYGQFWLQGHTVSDFINLHKQIWWYQNREDLEHSYGTTALFCVPKGLNNTKTWCPWILDIRGVYFSYEPYNQKAGFIYALGNPAIFWAGVIAISYAVGKFVEERKKTIALILLGYFIFWVPWIFAPRLLFLYHYLPSLPFLAIALGISLATIFQTKFKFLAILIILIFIAIFFYFYPISSDFPIDPSSIDKYMWLKSWR